MLDQDIDDWTRRIHLECATIGPNMYEPPESVTKLPSVMVPDWHHMGTFLNSGALAIASVKAKASATGQQ